MLSPQEQLSLEYDTLWQLSKQETLDGLAIVRLRGGCIVTEHKGVCYLLGPNATGLTQATDSIDQCRDNLLAHIAHWMNY